MQAAMTKATNLFKPAPRNLLPRVEQMTTKFEIGLGQAQPQRIP
jgi:hypothetical protein